MITLQDEVKTSNDLESKLSTTKILIFALLDQYG